MEDTRIWHFEESLWTGDAANYQEKIDDQCVMVLPQPPFVMTGAQSIDAVSDTPRWDSVEFGDQQVMRPEEGLIVIGYHSTAQRGDERYEAYCTTTMRRLSHEEWRVVQHQQMVPLAKPVEA